MNTVFRPKSNLLWAGLAFALDAVFLAQLIFYPSAGSNLLVDLSVAIFVAAAAYLLWVRPKLILREIDLVVVNPFQRTLVNYADITELRTKWALQIDYADKSVQVWVAPANGKGRWISESTLRWKSDRVPLSDTRSVEHTSMSQSTRSDSGLAASLIRERMKH